MKIAFYGLEDEWKKQFFTQKLTGHELIFVNEGLSEQNIATASDAQGLSLFVSCNATSAVLEKFPNLKLIVVRSTGFDNIDLEYTKQKNIAVANVPAYGSHTVAEFTFALILSLSRRVPEAVKRIKDEGKFDYSNLRGFDLNEKTLGVVGTGKIGQNVIKIAKGFNMKVLGFDAFAKQELASELGFEYKSLEELLANSDIITLHTPYNKDTHHLINKENIFKIKKGAYLINTSRGAVVESSALYEAVTQNHLAGAGLDVVEEENILKEEETKLEDSTFSLEIYKSTLEDHVLMDLPNVIITPHMAFFTKEAEEAIQQTTVDNINSYLSGSAQNLVNH